MRGSAEEQQAWAGLPAAVVEPREVAGRAGTVADLLRVVVREPAAERSVAVGHPESAGCPWSVV